MGRSDEGAAGLRLGFLTHLKRGVIQSEAWNLRAQPEACVRWLGLLPRILRCAQNDTLAWDGKQEK